MIAGHAMETHHANIAETLRAQALERPRSLAVFCPAGQDRAGRVRHTHWTFAQLDHESDLLAEALTEHGIGRGVRTVLMVRPSLEFFALTFALFKAGAVPVLIDPGIGLKGLKTCIGEAESTAFIGVPKAHAARQALGWGKETLRTFVTVGRAWPGGGPTLTELRRKAIERAVVRHDASPWPIAPEPTDAIAAVLFTSGSTGIPKGAVYTHGIFRTQVNLLREVFGIRPGEIDLCTFPLFALFAPALGMTSIIPEMDPTRPAQVDPRKIVSAIEDFGVTNLFGSPALIRRVAVHGNDHGVKLPSLRRVLSAGAPVPANVLEWFGRLLDPEALIHTPYGATEALPVAAIDHRTILDETRAATDRGAGICVGRPVSSAEVRIVRISDEPIPLWSEDIVLPDGEVGEIVVRGPMVSPSYLDRSEATALAKIDDPSRAAFYHRMGDLGYLDDQGRLWFCGRKSHRLETPQGRMLTIPCEAVFNTHPLVSRTALVGVRHQGAIRPVICVEPIERLSGSRKTAVHNELRAIAQSFDHTGTIETFLFHRSFPVDIRHNAKIFREKLAAWAARKLGWTP